MRGLDLLEDCQYRVCSKCGHWHRASKRIFVHFKTLLFMSHLLQQKKTKQTKNSTLIIQKAAESWAWIKKEQGCERGCSHNPRKESNLDGLQIRAAFMTGFLLPLFITPLSKKKKKHRKTSEIKLCAKFDVCKLILLDRRKAVKQSGLVVLRARYCQIQARCTTTQEGVCVFEEQTQIIWKSHANSDWKAGQPF